MHKAYIELDRKLVCLRQIKPLATLLYYLKLEIWKKIYQFLNDFCNLKAEEAAELIIGRPTKAHHLLNVRTKRVWIELRGNAALKITENHWKSLKITENHWKSLKINEIESSRIKIFTIFTGMYFI
jgi:hypothetical protein